MECHKQSIARLHVTSRRPCWWSGAKAFLSSGNLWKWWIMKILREKFYCINPQGDLPPISTSLQISRLKFSGQRSFEAVSCICHGQQMGKGQTKKVQRSYGNHSPAITATTIAEIELFISQRLLSLRSLESGVMWSLWSQPSLNDHSDGSDYMETEL